MCMDQSLAVLACTVAFPSPDRSLVWLWWGHWSGPDSTAPDRHGGPGTWGGALVEFPLSSSWSLSSAAWEFNDSLPVDVSEISHKHVSSASGTDKTVETTTNSENCVEHRPVDKTCDIQRMV